MPSLTITTIQTELAWEDKALNLQRLEEKVLAISEPTEIVVLPEMFSTGFTMNAETLAEEMDGVSIQWMRRLAQRKKEILTGSLIIREAEKHYNRLVWMLPNGQLGYYDKRHLFGLGEEDAHYQPGGKRLIAAVKGWRLHLLVCYDLRFPVWSRNRVLTQEAKRDQQGDPQPEYDVLIYVANWPAARRHAWKTLLMARAIENLCYVIGVNRVGVDGKGLSYAGGSMVVGPLGEILYHCEDSEAVHTTVLNDELLRDVRTRLPFWKDADGFTFS